MKINYLAVWVKDLEVMKVFYCRYFYTTANEKYINDSKQFQSYFLSFNGGPGLVILTLAKL